MACLDFVTWSLWGISELGMIENCDFILVKNFYAFLLPCTQRINAHLLQTTCVCEPVQCGHRVFTCRTIESFSSDGDSVLFTLQYYHSVLNAPQFEKVLAAQIANEHDDIMR